MKHLRWAKAEPDSSLLDHTVRPSFQHAFLQVFRLVIPQMLLFYLPVAVMAQKVSFPLSFAGFSIILESLAIIPLW